MRGGRLIIICITTLLLGLPALAWLGLRLYVQSQLTTPETRQEIEVMARGLAQTLGAGVTISVPENLQHAEGLKFVVPKVLVSQVQTRRSLLDLSGATVEIALLPYVLRGGRVRVTLKMRDLVTSAAFAGHATLPIKLLLASAAAPPPSSKTVPGANQAANQAVNAEFTLQGLPLTLLLDLRDEGSTSPPLPFDMKRSCCAASIDATGHVSVSGTDSTARLAGTIDLTVEQAQLKLPLMTQTWHFGTAKATVQISAAGYSLSPPLTLSDPRVGSKLTVSKPSASVNALSFKIDSPGPLLNLMGRALGCAPAGQGLELKLSAAGWRC